jgi:diguanylate cyclase (GGDEF)-like protein
VAVAANESDSVRTAVRTCLDLICEHTRWPAGHAFLQDESGELRPSGIWHVDPEVETDLETFRSVTEATRFGHAAGPPARVLATGRATWIDDLAEDREFLNGELAEELGVRATFAVPVLIGREVVAVLEFFADRPVELDPQLLEVMRHVGAQLGRVLERERAAEALRAEEMSQRALHDSLTGLPTITLYTDRLTSALTRLARRPGTVAVMFLDLDRFKTVNDTLGHSAANELLIEAAERIKGVVRPSDTVARFGGDEFVVLCEDLPGKDEALRIAGRIVEALGGPYEAGGRPVTTSASVGVARATTPSSSSPTRTGQCTEPSARAGPATRCSTSGCGLRSEGAVVSRPPCEEPWSGAS